MFRDIGMEAVERSVLIVCGGVAARFCSSRMIDWKPAVGCVSGSVARLPSVTPSASNARRK